MWYIGVTYTTSLALNFTDLSPVTWLKPTSPYIYLRDLNLFDWYIFNLQSSGKYCHAEFLLIMFFFQL